MARRTAPKLIERRRVCFGGIPLDTPPLAAGSFIDRDHFGRKIQPERKASFELFLFSYRRVENVRGGGDKLRY